MKSITILAVTAALAIASNASANEALAQKSGCMKCHDIDKKKKGPSFKESAANYKGKDAQLLKDWKENHEDVKISDSDLNTLLKWVQSR